MRRVAARTPNLTFPLCRLLNCPLLFLLLTTVGCSSSGSAPPHVPQFTTIDPPAPATLGGQGFFAVGMASNGIIAGYYFDSGGGTHGYLRELDGTNFILLRTCGDAADGIAERIAHLRVEIEEGGFVGERRALEVG